MEKMQLVDDMITTVLTYLESQSLCEMKLVSTQWNQCVRQSVLWEDRWITVSHKTNESAIQFFLECKIKRLIIEEPYWITHLLPVVQHQLTHLHINCYDENVVWSNVPFLNLRCFEWYSLNDQLCEEVKRLLPLMPNLAAFDSSCAEYSFWEGSLLQMKRLKSLSLDVIRAFDLIQLLKMLELERLDAVLLDTSSSTWLNIASIDGIKLKKLIVHGEMNVERTDLQSSAIYTDLKLPLTNLVIHSNFNRHATLLHLAQYTLCKLDLNLRDCGPFTMNIRLPNLSALLLTGTDINTVLGLLVACSPKLQTMHLSYISSAEAISTVSVNICNMSRLVLHRIDPASVIALFANTNIESLNQLLVSSVVSDEIETMRIAAELTKIRLTGYLEIPIELLSCMSDSSLSHLTTLQASQEGIFKNQHCLSESLLHKIEACGCLNSLDTKTIILIATPDWLARLLTSLPSLNTVCMSNGILSQGQLTSIPVHNGLKNLELHGSNFVHALDILPNLTTLENLVIRYISKLNIPELIAALNICPSVTSLRLDIQHDLPDSQLHQCNYLHRQLDQLFIQHSGIGMQFKEIMLISLCLSPDFLGYVGIRPIVQLKASEFIPESLEIKRDWSKENIQMVAKNLIPSVIHQITDIHQNEAEKIYQAFLASDTKPQLLENWSNVYFAIADKKES